MKNFRPTLVLSYANPFEPLHGVRMRLAQRRRPKGRRIRPRPRHTFKMLSFCVRCITR